MTPSVRLSPNVRYLEKRSCGGGRTVTLKLQLAAWPRVSFASQDTAVVPTMNWWPGCTEQVVVIGAVPLVVRGASNGTTTGLPSVESPVTAVGQVIARAGGAGATGELPPQLASIAATVKTRAVKTGRRPKARRTQPIRTHQF